MWFCQFFSSDVAKVQGAANDPADDSWSRLLWNLRIVRSNKRFVIVTPDSPRFHIAREQSRLLDCFDMAVAEADLVTAVVPRASIFHFAEIAGPGFANNFRLIVQMSHAYHSFCGLSFDHLRISQGDHA